MDKELQNFIDKAKNMKMPEKDKLFLRSKLSTLPMPSPLAPVRSPCLSPSHFWTLGKALVAACLIIVLGGGSLSYAAEKSLPGEFLYPVKTEFNEEVISAIKFTPEAKVAWQEKRVGRRLKEIETLTQKHKLNDQARIQIENNLEKHQKKAEKLKRESKIDIDDGQIIKKVEKARAGLKNREDEKNKESREDEREKSRQKNLKEGDD